MRLLVLVAVAVGIAALAGCGGGSGSGGTGGDAPARIALAAAQTAPAAAGSQGITVVGTGSAETVPDIAGWSFGVRTRAESAEEALRQNGAAMQRLLEALRGAGIAGDDLRTEQVSLYPQTQEEYSGEGGGILGYVASNTVHATVREMAKAGALVDAAAAAGANEVYGPELRVEDSRSHYEQAVEAAYDDARARAAAVAAKAGLTLGEPVAIVEGGGGGPEPYARALAEAADATVIEPGRQSVTATLVVTFAIA